MAGVAFNIAFDDGGAVEAFALLVQFGGDPSPALKEIGEYLLRRTEDRFNTETGPDGARWLAVSPATRASKKHAKVLTESSRLRDSFVYQVEETVLEFGTNVIYGAAHQFGFEAGGLPARPFIDIDHADEVEIAAVLGEYLAELAAGRAGPAA